MRGQIFSNVFVGCSKRSDASRNTFGAATSMNTPTSIKVAGKQILLTGTAGDDYGVSRVLFH